MTVRWGILGAGDIARKQTATAMREAANAVLTAVMRRDLGAAEAFAREFGAIHACDNAAALLTDPAIDAVYVATPVHMHAAHAIAAAQAGKHVLVEKPMAMSTGECQAMIDACERAGVQLMVSYYQRFNARHERARELVRSGGVGQVTMGAARLASYYPPIKDAWRQDPSRGGGGALMDVGIHAIDTLRYVVGEVEEISALVDTLVHGYAVDDTATLLMRLEGGVQATVSASFAAAPADVDSLNYLEVLGTEGRIWTGPLTSKDSSGALRVMRADAMQEYSFERRTHVAMIEAFGRAIEEGAPNPVPGSEGLRGLAVIEAACESSQSGRRVRVR